MKRWGIRIAICLVLGVVTTIAVAWACAAWLRISHYERYVQGVTIQSSDGWFVRAYRCSGAEYVVGLPIYERPEGWRQKEWADDLLRPGEVPWMHAYLKPLEAAPGQKRVKVVNVRGWPRMALWCEVVTSPSWARLALSPEAEGGIPFSLELPEWTSAVDEVGALPFRPIWSGLAIDTLFYGALWAVVIVTRGFIRRRAQFLTLRLGAAAVVISTVLGAISTVCVVLGCAVWVDEEYTTWGIVDFYGVSRGGDGFRRWTVKGNAQPGAVRMSSRWSISRGGGGSGHGPDGPAKDYVPRWGQYLVPTGGSPTFADGWQAIYHRVLDARGWPMLAMWGGFEVPQHIEDGAYIGTLGKTTHAIVLPRYFEGKFRQDWSRVIPLAPIWPGFLVDTIFYGVIWLFLLLLLAGPGIIKRSIRHSRGRCINCGYDLRGAEHEACPECGVDV